MAQPQDQHSDGAHRRGDEEVDGVVHAAPSREVRRLPCWASRPQSSPPFQRSRFQMGAVAFSRSIPYRAAGTPRRVRASCATTTASLTDRDLADPVDHRDPPDLGPANPDLGRHPFQGRDDLLGVRLVAERRDVGTPGGVVAGGPGEEHDGTAIGAADPPIDLRHRTGRTRSRRASRRPGHPHHTRHNRHRRRIPDPAHLGRPHGRGRPVTRRHYRLGSCTIRTSWRR